MNGASKSELSTELGHYKPAFFHIHVNSHRGLGDFGKDELPTLAHEYIHFLQDISTTFGIVNASRTVDYIKSLSNYIANSPKEEVGLPIAPSELHPSISVNDALFKVYFGSEEDLLYDGGPMITEVEASVQAIDGGKYTPEVVTVGINYGGPLTQHLSCLGAITIMESMAQIAEHHLFPAQSQSNLLRYHLAEMVAEYMYREFATTENVFMLCDVSLLSFNPGEAFYNILMTMKAEGFLPKSPEDFYQHAIDCVKFTGQDGAPSNLMSLLEAQAAAAVRQIKDLFTAKELAFVGEWIGDRVRYATQRRRSRVHFIADLLFIKDKDTARRHFLNNLIPEFQLPIISNAEGMSWAPKTSGNDVASPLLLPAMYEVYKTFRYGKKNSRCGMKIGCLESQGRVTVDDLCDTAPWKRSFDSSGLCLFGQVCKMWGITGTKQIVLTA